MVQNLVLVEQPHTQVFSEILKPFVDKTNDASSKIAIFKAASLFNS